MSYNILTKTVIGVGQPKIGELEDAIFAGITLGKIIDKQF